ncbi:MAG: DsbA family protein [Massilia sp.]|jgi:predicted DsbA family dithiol-disulfide isomerase|nr:DsbA family protein [Massilia sp.]
MATKIVITSDYLCPWCFIGQDRLFKAIDAMGPRFSAELEWHPYELNPEMPETGMDRKQYRSGKFGWEKSLMLDSQVTAVGKQDGLTFDYANVLRAPNTRMAHRLTEFAHAVGKAREFSTAVFEAYFSLGKDIGDREVLLDIAKDVGIDRNEAVAFLDNNGGLESVRNAQKAAVFAGVRGVPNFLIGNDAIEGAQSVVLLEGALRAAVAEGAQGSAEAGVSSSQCGT